MLLVVVALTGADGHRQDVLARSQRADPARIVGAGGIVAIVEVEDDAPAAVAHAAVIIIHPLEIAAFDGVEEVAARAIGFRGTGGVAEGQEESAAVDIYPVDVERGGHAVENEVDAGGARE